MGQNLSFFVGIRKESSVQKVCQAIYTYRDNFLIRKLSLFEKVIDVNREWDLDHRSRDFFDFENPDVWRRIWISSEGYLGIVEEFYKDRFESWNLFLRNPAIVLNADILMRVKSMYDGEAEVGLGIVIV